jgi:hypothetical protein
MRYCHLVISVQQLKHQTFFLATVAKWWPNGLKRLATAVLRTSLVARSGGQIWWPVMWALPKAGAK